MPLKQYEPSGGYSRSKISTVPLTNREVNGELPRRHRLPLRPRNVLTLAISHEECGPWLEEVADLGHIRCPWSHFQGILCLLEIFVALVCRSIKRLSCVARCLASPATGGVICSLTPGSGEGALGAQLLKENILFPSYPCSGKDFCGSYLAYCC